MKTTTIIFDIDGTLVDSSEFDGKLYIAAVHDVLGNVSIRSDLHEYPNHTDTGILMDICEENDLSIDAAIPSVRARFGQLVGEYLNEGCECLPIPGAISLIDRLASNDVFHVGIATGGWGHTAEMKLDHVNFKRKGIPIASSDHGHERTQIMNHCRSRIRSAGITTYVGDGEWDQRASEQLGWKFIGVGNRLRGKCGRWVPDLKSLKLSDF